MSNDPRKGCSKSSATHAAFHVGEVLRNFPVTEFVLNEEEVEQLILIEQKLKSQPIYTK